MRYASRTWPPLTFVGDRDEVDAAQARGVTGKVNEAEWRGHPAETVLCVGFAARAREGGGWRIEYMFLPGVCAYIEGIVGHGVPTRHRVYDSADFTQLEPLGELVRKEPTRCA